MYPETILCEPQHSASAVDFMLPWRRLPDNDLVDVVEDRYKTSASPSSYYTQLIQLNLQDTEDEITPTTLLSNGHSGFKLLLDKSLRRKSISLDVLDEVAKAMEHEKSHVANEEVKDDGTKDELDDGHSSFILPWRDVCSEEPAISVMCSEGTCPSLCEPEVAHHRELVCHPSKLDVVDDVDEEEHDTDKSLSTDFENESSSEQFLRRHSSQYRHSHHHHQSHNHHRQTPTPRFVLGDDDDDLDDEEVYINRNEERVLQWFSQMDPSSNDDTEETFTDPQ